MNSANRKAYLFSATDTRFMYWKDDSLLNTFSSGDSRAVVAVFKTQHAKEVVLLLILMISGLLLFCKLHREMGAHEASLGNVRMSFCFVNVSG